MYNIELKSKFLSLRHTPFQYAPYANMATAGGLWLGAGRVQSWPLQTKVFSSVKLGMVIYVVTLSITSSLTCPLAICILLYTHYLFMSYLKY